MLYKHITKVLLFVCNVSFVSVETRWCCDLLREINYFLIVVILMNKSIYEKLLIV